MMDIDQMRPVQRGYIRWKFIMDMLVTGDEGTQ